MELYYPVEQEKQENQKNIRLQVVEVFKISSHKLEILAVERNPKQSEPTLKSNGEENYKKVLLEGVWTQNHITKHSIIHLVNPKFDRTANVYTINNSYGILVVEPDNLLTCTLVASTLFCERKTWLNHVFLGQIGTNRAMLVGTLVHEVFQHGVKNRIAHIDKLTKYLDELLDDATVMLETYSVELHLTDIRSEAISYISSIKEWIDKYMFSGPRYPLTNDSDMEVKVIGISDIEENVWSTKYGLKGKIDVTGSVRIYNKKNKSLVDKTIPLELKTGNPNLSASHAAQVSLYSMMIEDRYSETNQGFVIYLKEKAAMHNVALSHNIKRDLIQRRNQINYHMKSYFIGPDMIDQSRMCKNCERLTECVLMSNIYEPGEIEHYTGMKLLENEAIGHLDEKFNFFFRKYHEKLIGFMSKANSLEVRGDSQSKATGSFWTYTSKEAEARGTGFGKLQASLTNGKTDSTFITFRRHPNHIESTKVDSPTSDNFLDEDSGPLPKKQRIEDYFKPIKKLSNNLKVHEQARHFNAKLNFSRCRIAISLDLDVQNMDSQNSSTAIAIGFMNELKDDHFVMKLYEGTLDLQKSDLMYRVDKLEKRSQIDIERTVLVRLLAREDWRCDKIRQLILDPEFKPLDNIDLNLFVLSTAFEEIKELNAGLQKFVVEAVSTDNYYILNEKIEPNKAKVDKVISVLAKVVNILDRSLLIVAQNVDHLVELMRLLQYNKMKFILIDDGKSMKARYQFASNLVKVLQGESLDLNKKYNSYIRQHELSPIVITSYAMSIGGLLFTRRKFNYCVAYDCDTTELLISLSPMFCSDRHIIIDVKDEKGTAIDYKKCNDDISLGCHLRSLRNISAT